MAGGLHSDSLSVLATGLGILADVMGSATLIWRIAAERRQPGQSPAAEARAALVVAIALAIISAVIIAESAAATRSGDGSARAGRGPWAAIRAAETEIVMTRKRISVLTGTAILAAAGLVSLPGENLAMTKVPAEQR